MLTARERQSGFSILETLVALVVMSIGLLGIAAMQVESLRAGDRALMQTKAINLAADIADRIRANPGGLTSYATPMSGPPGNLGFDCVDTAVAGNNFCTPVQMAVFDVFDWKTKVADAGSTGLPQGQAEIALDLTAFPFTVSVTIQWDNRGETKTYAMNFQ